jgi:hypothetical protein
MESLRYLNKQNNQNERNLFNYWWREQININGTEVNYWSNQTSLTGINVLYGEEPNAGFAASQKLIVLVNLNSDSYLLSKFGIVADSDMNGVIHPIDFEEKFGTGSEPKAGDLIEMVEYGSDRIHFPKRGATVFELTEVIDEYVINPNSSHNVWFWKAKRYDYSYENGGPGSGQGNKPINDNDALEALADSNFNYTEENPCSNTGVYGEY